MKQPDGTLGCGITHLKACERREHEKREEKVLAEEAEKRRLFEVPIVLKASWIAMHGRASCLNVPAVSFV